MSGEIPVIEPVDRIRLSGRPIDVFESSMVLPDNPALLATCGAHLAEGRDGALLGDFLIASCRFPEKEAPDQSVYVQISCAGASRFRNRCRLALRQCDAAGI